MARAGRLADVGDLKAGIRKGYNPNYNAHLVGLPGEQPLQVEVEPQQLVARVPLPCAPQTLSWDRSVCVSDRARISVSFSVSSTSPSMASAWP